MGRGRAKAKQTKVAR
ncbi:MAG: DUF3073 family protein, partial [Actinobacteria bacterium]|nr:DUF3073 family protein [Actinomycetota bacterium]MTA35916.1 DUF3073 family protein [Actinomycetota bacterium]